MNFKKAWLSGFLAFAVGFSAGSLHAETIESEGVASIKASGIERARQLAIQDAVEQATRQSGVKIEGQSSVSSGGRTFGSNRLRATGTIADVKVVREWQVEDALHVQISSNVEPADKKIPVVHNYKKKIAATPFSVQGAITGKDVIELANGFPRELVRRLENSRRFLSKNSLYVISVGSAGLDQDPKNVMKLAAQYDSQFVISGEILDSVSAGDGWLSGVIGSRRFEVDLFVHDGLTGGLIARHRIDELIEKEFFGDRDKSFSSASFFSTKLGETVNKVINAAVELISKDVENLPFTAKVIRVTDGKIYIDAGGTSLLSPGDELVAYNNEKDVALLGTVSGHDYGVRETPVATVSVVQVQPMFSICVVLPGAENAAIKVGDFVRFDMVSQSSPPQ